MKTISIFDLDDTLLITPTFNDLIPKNDNGVIIHGGEFAEFFNKIKSFFLIVFSKEVYFASSGDYIAIYDSNTKKPINPVYLTYMQEFEPSAMSGHGLKNSDLRDVIRAIKPKDGQLVFESIPNFHTKPETVGVIVNDSVFNAYHQAKNKMILTGRKESLRDVIESRLRELGIEQPNCGLFLFPGMSLSVKDYKKEVILNTIEENGWAEVHFYEDKESWLYSAQVAVNERFPEVKFFPHLIATTRQIGSL